MNPSRVDRERALGLLLGTVTRKVELTTDDMPAYDRSTSESSLGSGLGPNCSGPDVSYRTLCVGRVSCSCRMTAALNVR